MRDLNFRKKRRRQANQKRRRKKKQELKFDTGRPELRFRREKTPAQKQNRGEIANWIVQNGDVVLVNRLVYNASKPKRGDIVAFKPNGNENTHYSIKRIVGLPGETVQIKDGKVYINEEEVTQHIFAEDIEEAGIADEPLQLGGDEYFVMGDNHAGSDDSRMADIGNVKRSEIYGKVWFVASPGSDFGFVRR